MYHTRARSSILVEIGEEKDETDEFLCLLTRFAMKLHLCRNYFFYTGVATRGRVSSYEIHLSKDLVFGRRRQCD